MSRRPCGTFDTRYELDIAVFRTPFHWSMFGLLMIGYLGLFPLLANDGYLAIANLISITLIATLGINFLTGYCGQISLGHAIFVACGGYISAVLMNHLGWSWWATLPVSVAGTALIGLFFGLPSLRIKGFYIAMSTLASYFIISWLLMHGGAITGSINGLPVDVPRIGAYEIVSQRQFYYLIAGFLILSLFVAKSIARGRLGRVFIAIRDDDMAAEVMGINVFAYKLIAFALCSAYAGLAGSLFATYWGFITFNHFPFFENIMYLGYVIIGGMGSIVGSIFGVLFLKLLGYGVMMFGPMIGQAFPAISGSVVASLLLIGHGAVIVVFLIFEPRGLFHRWEIIKASMRIWPFTY
ncbi:MAG: branched-chain amino acid ABC transporter permease [Proteobacteria bacterium]|nr:branched-chain amino acid ABC transporter permease [Pseudomonadota bacterium]